VQADTQTNARLQTNELAEQTEGLGMIKFIKDVIKLLLLIIWPTVPIIGSVYKFRTNDPFKHWLIIINDVCNGHVQYQAADTAGFPIGNSDSMSLRELYLAYEAVSN